MSTRDYIAAIKSTGYPLTGKETRNNLIFIYATLLFKGVLTKPAEDGPRATLTYSVRWSDENDEWVATSDAWPSLSYLHRNPQMALRGLIKLIKKCEDDIKQEGEEVNA